MGSINRRDFTKKLGVCLLVTQIPPAHVASKVFNQKANRVPIGLCNHSLRSLRLNATQFIEFAIEHKFDSVLFNNFQPLESLEESYLKDLKKLAQSRNVSIYIGAGNISEKSPRFNNSYGSAQDLLKKGIRVASLLGSPVVGCRIGNVKDRFSDGGIEKHIEAVVNVMKSVKQYALNAGIKFAFENHAGDMRTSELLTLIQETGTDICGALFDPANAVWAMEDPMNALENLGDLILCTSVRDVQVWPTDEGASFQGTAIGDGVIDWGVFTKLMAEKCAGVPMHIETISNSARSVPFLKSEYWEAYPNLPASEFVNFIKFINTGKKLNIILPPYGTSKKDFDIEYQQSELLRSADYLRKFY